MFSILLVFCFFTAVPQQGKNTTTTSQQYTSDDTIHWSKGRKLTWEDFKGIPDSASTGMAGTSSSFFYRSYYTTDTTLEFVVNTIFFKKYSWIKDRYKDIATLNHEQKHFDISEVYARKLKNALKNYKLNKTTILRDCNYIYDSIVSEANRMQALYDKETTKPINNKKQKEWDEKITIWLNKSY